MLRLRGLQETSNQDLRPFRRSRRVEQFLSALPHCCRTSRIETCSRVDLRDSRSLQFAPVPIRKCNPRAGWVESRWAINIVIASRLTATSRMVSLISSSSKNQATRSLRRTPAIAAGAERARAIESRCFSPPETSPASPIFESSPWLALRSNPSTAAWRKTSRHSFVRGVRAHELQVLANRSGKQLRVLRHESNSFTQIFNCT